MSAAVETWNALAERVLSGAWTMAWASAWVLVLAGLLWAVLRRRASAHLGAALFLMPLIPLVLPLPTLLEVSVPVGGPVARWLAPDGAGEAGDSQAPEVAPTVDAAPRARVHTPTVGATDGRSAATGRERAPEAAFGTAPDARLADDPTTTALGAVSPTGDPRGAATSDLPWTSPTPAAWGLLAWAVVVATLLARFLAAQLATWRLIAASAARPDPELAALAPRVARLARRVGLRAPVRLVPCPALASPAAWGVGRPTLLLPPGIGRRLDAQQLDWVLLHELAHLARRDLLVAAVQRVVQILWFFHPLVWWTNRAVEELREQACDEAALALTPHARPDRCAEALLTVAARTPEPRTAQLALQSLTPDVTLMKKRILRLLDPRPARRGLGIATVPLLVAVASVSLAGVSLRPTVDAPDAGGGLADVHAPGSGATAPAPATEPAENALAQDPAPRAEQEPPHHGVRQPMADAHGQVEPGSAAEATARALPWILAQQHEDGHWPTGPETDRATGEVTIVGMTGFAVLCLLEAEAQGSDPARERAIERGLAWLASQQDEETGRFGLDHDIRMVPSHAVATWAWIAGMRGRDSTDWRERAQRAVHYLLRARNPYGAWRYDVPPVGDNDTVITSLVMLALAEAQDVGLPLDPQAREGAMNWYQEVYDPRTGRTGYNQRGNPPSRLAGKKEDFPGKHSELCTAISILARLDWGEDPVRTPPIRKGAMLLVDQAPVWDVGRGTVDSYYWTFGTLAMSRLGGFTYEHWRQSLVQALTPRQLTDGSWSGYDAWSDRDTTVHSTVMHTWSLLAAQRED